MRRRLFEATWRCPICNQTGNKWLIVRSARKHGRTHIKNFHKEDIEPIITKRRRDAGNK